MMNDEYAARPSVPWREWLPVLSAAALLFGAAYFQGGQSSQQIETTRRVGALEAKIETIQLIDVRTTRIEAKLDMLTAEDPRQARDQRRQGLAP